MKLTWWVPHIQDSILSIQHDLLYTSQYLQELPNIGFPGKRTKMKDFFYNLAFSQRHPQKMEKAITGNAAFSKIIVLSSWRYETILRMVCFGGVDMMDPPSKV